jgi:hypothetical protein
MVLYIIQIGKILYFYSLIIYLIIRYRLHFQRESRDEIDRRKKLAQLPIKRLPEESLEIPIEQIYRPGSALDLPIRPAWTYDMTKEQLEQQEQTYFNVKIIFISKKKFLIKYFFFCRIIWIKFLQILMQNI